MKTLGPLSGSVTVGRPWHRRTAEAASRLARATAALGRFGNVRCRVGCLGPGYQGRTLQPGGVALNKTGGLVIADTGNHRIRAVSG